MPPLKRILPAIFLMTSHLDSHRTTDIRPEMLSGVQTGNGTPHNKYNIRGIAHVHKNRKDNIFMQRQLVQNFTFILEWGKGLVHWQSTHSTWHIPGIFFLHAACSALRHFFLLKFVFYWMWSSIEAHHLSRVIFHQKLSSNEGFIPSKVVFHLSSFSIEGCLPSKGIFHLRSSSISGCLPL